ncbi:MAG: phage shock protein operon transcriptional activator [Aeromonadaceae bacterium]
MQDERLLGESNAFGEVLEQVSRLAVISRPVLVIGERGTGKELIAHRLHYLSARWQQPFISVNCATLNESLLESELFGHEAGSFTGAQKRHPGRFERADGGTLFLDELATMSERLQEKLLRVLEYGEFERVGGQQPIRVDVRLICATNANLPQLAASGKFRADLLDRIAFDVVTLPPLRARQEDILLLARHFAEQLCIELGIGDFSGFSPAVEGQLLSYSWPGNVRELRNVIERSLYRQGSPHQPLRSLVLNPFDSPWSLSLMHSSAPLSDMPPPRFPLDLKRYIAGEETRMITAALQASRYNQRMAAQSLGISYDQFRGLLKKYKLSVNRGQE